MLYYLASEFNVWGAAVPFEELEPETGEEFLTLCRENVSWRTHLLREIAGNTKRDNEE